MNVCALALMTLHPLHSVPLAGPLCTPSGYTRTWDQLLHPVAIAENDTRYGLKVGGRKFGLSTSEREWVSQVTGHVICPGDKNLMGQRGSGTLIGRNDQILASAHVVRNRDGTSRTDWPRCYFETQSDPVVRRGLKFFDPGTIFGTRTPNEDRDLDYVILRLDQPIQGVKPVSIANNANLLSKGQSLLMVSAFQERLKPGRKLVENEPIIQSFTIRSIVPSKNDRGMVVSSDSSGMDGTSGSIILTRDSSGELAGIGLHTAGASPRLDGKQYDPTPYEGNQSFELMFDGPLRRDLERSLNFDQNL